MFGRVNPNSFMRFASHFASWRLFIVRVAFLFGLAAATGTVRPAVLVVPNSLEDADDSFGSGTLRAAGLRMQFVYGSVHFPPDIGVLITELRFRPDRAAGFAFTGVIASLQVNLSTTTRNPDELSTVYAQNVGVDDLVVFSGTLPVSSQFTGPPFGPKTFDIVIPLTTPFLYNPAAGNLLVDIRNFAGNANVSPLSGQASPFDSASRVGGDLVGNTPTALVQADAQMSPTSSKPKRGWQ